MMVGSRDLHAFGVAQYIAGSEQHLIVGSIIIELSNPKFSSMHFEFAQKRLLCLHTSTI